MKGKGKGRRLQFRASLVIPALLSLTVLLPLFFLAGGSLMGALEYREMLGPALLEEGGFAIWRPLPRFPTLRLWVELLLDSPAYFVMFWNSAKITVLVLLGQVLVSVPAAWWFARQRTRLAKALFTLYIVLMLMPFQVTMVSSYIVLDLFTMLDTHGSVILPGIFSTFPVFLIYRFFRTAPDAMLEAAEIDGAGGFQVFLHVGLPLGGAGVASALVLGFLEYWNLMEQPMTFLKSKALWPLSLYLPQVGVEGAGFALAVSVVTLLPALLVFFVGQSYLEEGITASGVKE